MNSPIFKKIFITLSICALLWVVLTSTPLNFRNGTIVTISKGDSVKIVAQKLKQDHVIQSGALFTNLIIFFNLDSKIVAGDYSFKTDPNLFNVMNRIATGDYGIEVKRITLFEGLTASEMAKQFAGEFYNINEVEFIEKATPYEGYLFPDTYYFAENVSPEEVIAKMRTTFDEKIAGEKDILNSKRI